MPDKEKIKELKKEESKEEKIEKLGKELKKLEEEQVEEVEEETEEEVEADTKKTFEHFKEFFDSNEELDNSEIYKAFPTVSQATLRGWKSKAKLLKKKDPETPDKEQGEELPTPLTKKEIDELVANKLKEALKIKRKEPSKATQVSEPVNPATIKANWFEEIV